MDATTASATNKTPEQSSSSNKPIENLYDLKCLDEYENEIEWLNELLAHQDNETMNESDQLSLTSLEIKLSKLNSVLELAISDTSTLVDKSIDEIARNIPRLSLDLQLMKENALLLRSSLKNIHSKSQILTESQPEAKSHTSINLTPDDKTAYSDDTDQLLSHLKTLDLIKERMELTRTVLREAEAWSTLESEVTGYLTDPIPSHLKAAERLAEAAKSMAVFHHTPEYEGRRGLMRSLQNELEASLSTSVVKALNDKDIARCKEFYEIFKMIEREPEFKNYYFGSRRSVISSLWSQTILSSPTFITGAVGQSVSMSQVKLGPNSLPVFLAKRFYPELLKLLQAEIDFLPFIFITNPVETLAEFLRSVLENLKPSISTRLVESVGCAHILAAWPSLISCWNLTEEIGWKLEGLISQLDSKIKQTIDAVSSPTSPSVTFQVGSTPSKLDRRASLKRPTSRSIGSKGQIDFSHHRDSLTVASQTSSVIKDWENSLYEPFTDFQSNYHKQEADYLQACLKTIMLHLSPQETRDSSKAGQQLMINVIQKLQSVLESMFALSDNALDRCEAFTHGYGILGYIKAVDFMFCECLDTHKKALITERESREKKKESVAQYNLSGGGTGKNKIKSKQSYSDDSENQFLQLEGLDYSSEDWEVFQLGLKLLVTCKTVYDKLDGYEQNTKARLISILHSIRNKDSDETIALNDDLELVKIKLSKGARVILGQSPLNSCELWEFFDSLQPSSEGSINTSTYLGHRRESKSTTRSPNLGENKQQRRQSIRNSQIPKGLSSVAHNRPLYLKTNLSVSNLIKESQRIVQSIILLPLLKQVNEYPHLPIWSQTENEAQRINQINSISTVSLKLLNQFSKSPTESISKLGEGLFNLPRLFEIYTTVDEDALSFSLETLPFINYSEVLSNWQEFHHQASLVPSPNEHLQSSGNFNDDNNNSKHPNLSSEMVISTWLSSLTLAVVNQFTQNIANFFLVNNSDNTSFNNQNQRILLPSQQQKIYLSSSGKAQLLIDLDYLNNVVKALDVETDMLDKLQTEITA